MREPNTSSVEIMSSEIIKAGDGNIHVSDIGVQFEGEIPESAVDDLLQQAGRAARVCLFIIGATVL